MFDVRISAGATESLLERDKNCAHVTSWPHDMEGHA